MTRVRLAVLALLVASWAPLSVTIADEKPLEPRIDPGLVPHEIGRLPYMPGLRGAGASSPRMLVSRDGLISYQVNVDAFGDNILGDAANEPSLAVNPTDPNNMVIGWRQFDSIASDFRQAGWAYTLDRGETWIFPGRIEPGWFRSDPVLDADANGVFYYNSLTNDPDYQCRVFRSFDKGMTWDSGVFAQGGDKQWQVIDTTGGPGNGNIYAAWNPSFSTTGCNGQFTRKIAGAPTFDACTATPNSPIWGTLAVGPDGELYLCGGSSFGTTFRVNKSLNAQFAEQIPSWTSAVAISGPSFNFSEGPNPGGLGGQLSIDVDHSNGPRRGWVYLCGTLDPTGTDPGDVLFTRSADGGATWSAPQRLNDDAAASNNWQWFGTMSVAPTGRIDVVWLDTRANPGTFLSELYYTYSEDGGTTWTPNTALSPAFNPHIGWPQQNKMGDYFDMTSLSDAAHLTYAATFNGEQDVYFIRITRGLALSLTNAIPTRLPPGEPITLGIKALPGTETYVPDTAMVHFRYNGGTWRALPMTPTGADTFAATLPPTYCGAMPEIYFSAVGTESGEITLPRNAPTDAFTIDIGVEEVLYGFNLDTNPGWTTEDQWAYGTPTGGGTSGRLDPTSGYTGTKVYGFNLAGSYPNSMAVTKYLTTTPLDFTGINGVSLRFRRWLGVESATYDHANIQASSNGTTWTTIWDHAGGSFSEQAWTLQTYDISGVADNKPAVQIRWGMGPTDTSVVYQGWNIDDIEFTAVLCNGPALCAGDVNCDGVVTFADIDLFIEALGAPNGSGWNYDCPWLAGDTNGDNNVDFSDIDSFIARIGATCN